MTKGLKLGALSFVASALLSTSAFAATLSTSPLTGTIAGNSVTSKATELKATATITNMKLGTYTPTAIALTTLSNPTFNYGVQNGKITLDTANKQYYVVEMAGTTIATTDKIVAKYTAGSGYNAIAFGATGPQVSNNNKYVIVAAGSTVPGTPLDVAVDGTTDVSLLDVAGNTLSSDVAFSAVPAEALTNATSDALTGITYTQTTAAASDSLIINLGQGDSQVISDRAMQSIMTSGVQLCASVTEKANALIDPLDNFMSFQAAATAACGATGNTQKDDVIKVTIRATEYDNNAVQPGDTAIVTIHATPALPVGTTAALSYTSEAASLLTGGCTISSDRTTVTCTTAAEINLTTGFDGDPATLSTTDEAISVKLSVPGDVAIERTTFTADAEFNFETFSAAQASDYLKSLNNPLFAGADAGAWEYKGTTIQTPTINSNDDTNTMIKLNNDSDVNARVFWTLADDQGHVASMIEVASSEGNTGLAAGTSNTWLASALRAAASTNGIGEKFRGHAIVTSESGVSAVSVMMINGGRDRVIPLVTTTTAP